MIPMDDPVFPRAVDAPASLRALEGSCGPVAAWQVLKHFGYEIDISELLDRSQFDSEVGAYAIGLAVALAEYGLRVFFYSDADPEPGPVELALHRRAKSLGVTFRPGADLVGLDYDMGQGEGVAVLLYEANNAIPHFTPFLALQDGELVAPNEGDGLVIGDIESRRSAPGIYRQAVLAFRQ